MHDFDTVVDRRNSNSLKWVLGKKRLTQEQANADPLPMWVADMDFRIAEPIEKALRHQLDVGTLGYSGVSNAYLQAVAGWQTRKFGWNVQPEWIVPAPGVVSALNVAIQAFTNPGDYVVVSTPVYIHFHQDVIANGRRLIQVPLDEDNGKYRFDADRFEAALLPRTKLFILCNPHNPTGNVWTEAELRQISEICSRRGILVVSDEVHEDLIFNDGPRHIPFASLGDDEAANTVVCTAPSKTFNLAGLQCANIIIPNAKLRDEFRAHYERAGLTLVNAMGAVASEVAYTHCDDWVSSMLRYVAGNHKRFKDGVESLNLPISITPTDALYLAWLDFRELGMEAAQLNDHLLRKARLWLDDGRKFGPVGDGFMRINLACPSSTVDEALNRLASAIRA